MSDTKQCKWCDEGVHRLQGAEWRRHKTGWVHNENEEDKRHFAYPRSDGPPPPGPAAPPPSKQQMFGG